MGQLVSSVSNAEEVWSSSNHCPITLGFDAGTDSYLPLGVVRIVVILVDAYDNVGGINNVSFHLACFV